MPSTRPRRTSGKFARHGPGHVDYPEIAFFRPVADIFTRPPPDDGALSIGQIGLHEPFNVGECHRPRGTPGYAFLVHFEDAFRLHQDGVWSEQPAGTTVLWSSQAPHRYGTAGGRPFRHSYVFVRGNLVERWLRLLPLDRPVAGIAQTSFTTHLYPCVCEFLRPRPQAATIEACCANLLRAVRDDVRGQDGAGDPRVAQVRNRIATGIHRRWSLAGLAREVGLSPAALGRLFRAEVGQSPIAYLISLRLGFAGDLLRTTDQSVGAIAAQVGYADAFLFSRQFRRKYGCSPVAWRREAANRATPSIS